DVDDVDVLLDDDVAGERDVVDPVAQATRRGRRVGPLGPLDRRSEVVDLARDGRPDLAGMHAPGELDVWRGVADLEAYREAQLPRARLLPERHHRLRAGHVDGDRLLEVDVLAGADGGLEVRGMEPGRRRDVDRVHVLVREQRLVRVQALVELRRSERRLAELGRLL